MPEAFILVGGHAAAAYPSPLQSPEIDAICTDDGEEVVPAVADALASRRPLREVPALLLRSGEEWTATAPLAERTGLDAVPLPARGLVERDRGRYHCLLFKPVWLVETARGCPFRCNFCSVWQLYGRSFRERSIAAVVEDLASVGESVFIADDLFWNHPARSLELAGALKRRGVRKRWILVQTRTDIVCRHPELLEAWRPLAKDFDIFFGLEAASDAGLASVTKDAGVSASIEAARISRSLGYGVTGNFLVDPDWDEAHFQELWDFVATHGFQRAGYTILTPLPGTELFQKLAPILEGQPWFKYDMHHVLWEPRLGRPPVLRALRGDLAPLDPQHERREALGRLDAADPALADPVSDQRAPAHAAHDEGAGVSRGASRRAADEPRRPASSAGSFLSPTQLHRVLPQGESLSHHTIRVGATRERTWESLLAQDLASSPLSRVLLALRGYGGRAFRSRGGTFPEKLQRFGFTPLAEEPGSELVFGLAGRFWRPDGGLRPIPDREAFLAFAEEGCVKAAWNLRIGAIDDGSCDLSTETRIEYFGDAARRKFRVYWWLIGPFSGAIRRALLRRVHDQAERPG